MPVLVELFSVIVRNVAIERIVDGGLAAFMQNMPNNAHCTDRHLTSIHFMIEADAAQFVHALSRSGIVSDGTNREVVIFQPGNNKTDFPRWLQVDTIAGHQFAWQTDTEKDPLVVPPYWEADRAPKLFSQEDLNNIEFLERRGPIDVYIDRTTGKEYYAARTAPESLPNSPDETDESGKQALEIYQRACEIIGPFLPNNCSEAKTKSKAGQEALSKGVKDLEQVIARFPGSPEAHFAMGMSLRGLGQTEESVLVLQRAYELSPPGHTMAVRELILSLLLLGRNEEAAKINRQIVAELPDDGELLCNLGLCLLLLKKVDEAIETIARSTDMNPSDHIAKTLLKIATQVKDGKRDCPTRYPFR